MLSAAIPVMATWLYLCYIFQGVYNTIHHTRDGYHVGLCTEDHVFSAACCNSS